jgi:predicted ATP-grasp superfamily ATP-dependent carboligase
LVVPRNKDIDYCIAPESLAIWFSAFAELSANDRTFHIGEKSAGSDVIKMGIGFRGSNIQKVVILSSHESLLRDLDLAELLRKRGTEVDSQTPEATMVGLDKVKFKEVLDALGVATPAWGHLSSLSSTGSGILLKMRNGTQSRGIRWFDGVKPKYEHEWYWEEFVSGCEYSVVAYAGSSSVSFLPLVSKGETQFDLMPPWRRLRICPDPELSNELEDKLIEATRRVIEFFDIWGFVELEFVVDCKGRAFLLEINPRVCGTLRIAAMACNIKVFNFFNADDSRLPCRFPARRQALEAPYDGVPFVSEDLRVIASSRITIAAESCAELIELARTELGGQNEILSLAAKRLGV